MAAEKRTIFTSFNVMRNNAVAEGVVLCMKETCPCGRRPFTRPTTHAPAANNTNNRMLRRVCRCTVSKKRIRPTTSPKIKRVRVR